jgi:hypothetical protein
MESLPMPVKLLAALGILFAVVASFPTGPETQKTETVQIAGK